MAGKTAAEVAAGLDPRLKAMLMELGNARLDELPMEDGESGKRGRNTHSYPQPPDMSNGAQGVVPKIAIKSSWAKAIQRGDFDDDDAAQVSGMDSMEDGQLARTRRIQAAGNAAFTFANDKYKTNIRRDRNGYVPPRATAGNRGKHNVPGPIHVGDGLIDINRTISGSDARRPRPPPPGPIATLDRGAFGGSPPPRLSVHAQAAQSTAVETEAQMLQGDKSATQAQTCIILPDEASIVLQLPASLGAAAFPNKGKRYHGKVYLIAGSQPSKHMTIITVEDSNIPEIRYSISEYDTYVSFSNTGIMLKFTNSTGGFNFYLVDFETNGNMTSFVQALQHLVERSKQQLPGDVTVSAVKTMSAANGIIPPTATIEPAQPTSVVPVRPAASKIAEVAAIVEQKTRVAVQKQDEQKDVIARPLTDLQAKKQSDAASSSRETLTVPKPISDMPVSAVSVFKETPAAEGRTSSSSVVTTARNRMESSSAANLTSTLKSCQPEAVDTSVSQGTSNTAIPVEQPAQEVNITVQQTQAPFGVGREVIEDIIDWVWDTAKYIKHSVPEDFDFHTMRAIIRATSAATIGRRSPSFRQLSPGDQQHVIEGYVRPYVERGFLQKLACDDPLAAELSSAEVRQATAPQQPPDVQDNAEAQAVARSKLSPPVYEIEELMSMRIGAAAVDPGILPEIPRQSTKPVGRQAHSQLQRIPVKDQVKHAAVSNSDWLTQSKRVQGIDSFQTKPHDIPGEMQAMRNTAYLSANTSKSVFGTTLGANQGVPSPGSSKVEALADFLSPASGQKSGSPPVGLEGSIHNRGGAQLSGYNINQLTEATVIKSTYQKDLEGLVANGVDKGSAFNQKVVKATEGISRLSLD